MSNDPRWLDWDGRGERPMRSIRADSPEGERMAAANAEIQRQIQRGKDAKERRPTARALRMLEGIRRSYADRERAALLPPRNVAEFVYVDAAAWTDQMVERKLGALRRYYADECEGRWWGPAFVVCTLPDGGLKPGHGRGSECRYCGGVPEGEPGLEARIRAWLAIDSLELGGKSELWDIYRIIVSAERRAGKK